MIIFRKFASAEDIVDWELGLHLYLTKLFRAYEAMAWIQFYIDVKHAPAMMTD